MLSKDAALAETAASGPRQGRPRPSGHVAEHVRSKRAEKVKGRGLREQSCGPSKERGRLFCGPSSGWRQESASGLTLAMREVAGQSISTSYWSPPFPCQTLSHSACSLVLTETRAAWECAERPTGGQGARLSLLSIFTRGAKTGSRGSKECGFCPQPAKDGARQSRAEEHALRGRPAGRHPAVSVRASLRGTESVG